MSINDSLYIHHVVDRSDRRERSSCPRRLKEKGSDHSVFHPWNRGKGCGNKLREWVIETEVTREQERGTDGTLRGQSLTLPITCFFLLLFSLNVNKNKVNKSIDIKILRENNILFEINIYYIYYKRIVTVTVNLK